MGVEVAGRAAELAADCHFVHRRELCAQAVGEDADLLAQARGRRRLAVGLGEHGNPGPLVGELLEDFDHLDEFRAVDVGDGLLDRHRNRCVVDVLRGQAEVDKLFILFEAEDVELLLEEIFDGFDVVVGDRFDLLDARGVGEREVFVNRAQRVENAVVDSGELRQRNFAQSDEIFDLDAHAVAYQSEFRKILVEIGCF